MQPKISILIIAHNEASHIWECLESISHQSIQSDEIICIAHNCTDRTVDIVRGYPKVKIYELDSEAKWPIPARSYGFEKCSGDIIACLDGDSYASDIWLESITRPFENLAVNSVSWYPLLIGWRLFSYIFFLQWAPILRMVFDFYFWGANFACRKKDYESVWWMTRCEQINKELDLSYPAEDCILSFLLQEEWKLEFIRKATSYVYPGKYFDGENRGNKQREDLKKIRNYFWK